MQHLGIRAVCASALVAGAILAGPLAASEATSKLFGDLRLGAWEIRERGSDRIQRVCLRSERDLVQLRHRGQACRRIVVDDNATNATIQYSCGAAGYGRTSIRKETAELVQIRSDGFEKGAPFSIEAEGRRVGNCR